MRMTLTRRVGLLLLLPFCTALAVLAIFDYVFFRMVPEPQHFILATDQRNTAEHVAAYAKMVSKSQSEDREALRQLVFRLDRTLRLLEHGDPEGGSATRATSRDVQVQLAKVRARWQSVRPAVLLMSERSPDSQESRDAYSLAESTMPQVVGAATQVLAAMESRRLSLVRQMNLLFAVVACLDGALLVLGVWLIRRHVLDRNRVLAAMRETEERFQSLAQSTPDAIIIADQKGTIVAWNRSAETIFGYTAEEALGTSGSMLVPKRHERVYREHVARIMTSGTSDLVGKLTELDGLRKDGTEFPLEFSVSAWGTSGNRFSGAIIREIGQRKRLEEERGRLASAVEQAAEAVMITDGAGVVAYVNPAFERTSGYTRSEVMGQLPRMIKSGKHGKAFYRQMWATLRRGETWSGFLINRRKDGRLYEEHAVITPVRSASGTVVNYVAVKRDMTRERQLEGQLRQAQKMEALGRLAGGVAHDFNNLLTAILGHGHQIKRKCDPTDPLGRSAEGILSAAERGASLTRQLLYFSRQQVEDFRVLDINEIVSNTGKMIQRLVGEDIDLVIVSAPSPGHVRADAGQLQQVLINLSINARDAMPDGGKLTIETATVDLDAAYAESHLGVKPGRHVLLAVSDTGTGMSPEVKAHLFEPFFTTKVGGEGTGLGLSTVHGIVSKSGGHIGVSTQPGLGSTFKIYLPVTESTPEESSSGSVERGHLEGRETMLVVEDEEPLRRLICDSLSFYGYTILEATDVRDAIRICERHDQAIDLLLTDVVMPVMNGADLARRVTAIRPDLRVLFMSGYADHALLQSMLRGGTTAFLQKPFTPETLAHKVRAILDGPLKQVA